MADINPSNRRTSTTGNKSNMAVRNNTRIQSWRENYHLRTLLRSFFFYSSWNVMLMMHTFILEFIEFDSV